ncbi:MAG TPA: hypothetical protein DIC52_12615 [Candidatus Latescibacteria bacterium]|nr:hypothetical protein [Candidatus Latescibacterota bacterium]
MHWHSRHVPLGKTGQTVTALGLGGVCWKLLDDDAAAVEVVHRAIDLGITYLDSASGYKDCERKLGLALKEWDRDNLFVAAKCIKRFGDEVKQEIAQSFEDLGVETIDLIQLHAIDQQEGQPLKASALSISRCSWRTSLLVGTTARSTSLSTRARPSATEPKI